MAYGSVQILDHSYQIHALHTLLANTKSLQRIRRGERFRVLCAAIWPCHDKRSWGYFTPYRLSWQPDRLSWQPRNFGCEYWCEKYYDGSEKP